MTREPAVSTEDQLLTRIALDMALARLPEADRVMMLMLWKIEIPRDYDDSYPVTCESIGRYIGLKYEGEVLKESTIRYRRDVIMALLRGQRGPLRRSKSENP